MVDIIVRLFMGGVCLVLCHFVTITYPTNTQVVLTVIHYYLVFGTSTAILSHVS